MFKEFAKQKDAVEILAHCGLTDNDKFFAGIQKYYEDLMETNKSLNLTRITDPEEFWVKNILDSLLIAYQVPEMIGSDLENYVNVVDIGCGGGIPLIPLSIAFPYCEFTGFESRRKKVFYLLEQIERLGLKNCNVFPLRAIEASRQEEFCGEADIVTARAVARIEKLVPETVKFLAPKGRMVFYKTPTQLEEENDSAQAAVKKAKLQMTTSDIMTLPCEYGSRQFAIIKKKTRNRR